MDPRFLVITDRCSTVRTVLWKVMNDGEADLFDALMKFEDFRTRLNNLPKQWDSADWIGAAEELTEELTDTLADWQRTKTLVEHVQLGCTTRVALDRLMDRLLAHVSAVGDDPKADAVRADRLIGEDLEEGVEFWVKHFGPHVYRVRFPEFQQALGGSVPHADENTWTRLRAGLDAKNTGFVTAPKWASFLDAFGPSVSSAVDRLGDSLGEEFFAGFLTYDDARGVLERSSPGCYLIRFCTTQPGALMLTFKTDQGEIDQSLIHPKRGGFEMDDVLFPNLRELVQARPNLKPAPAVREIARTCFFKGNVSMEQTKKLLAGEPLGTFLFRLSNREPGCFVVAYKDAFGEVRQSKIFPDPQNGGFVLGKNSYPTIDAIIKANPTTFKHPLGGGGGNKAATLALAPARGVTDRYGGVASGTYGTVDRFV